MRTRWWGTRPMRAASRCRNRLRPLSGIRPTKGYDSNSAKRSGARRRGSSARGSSATKRSSRHGLRETAENLTSSSLVRHGSRSVAAFVTARITWGQPRKSWWSTIVGTYDSLRDPEALAAGFAGLGRFAARFAASAAAPGFLSESISRWRASSLPPRSRQACRASLALAEVLTDLVRRIANGGDRRARLLFGDAQGFGPGPDLMRLLERFVGGPRLSYWDHPAWLSPLVKGPKRPQAVLAAIRNCRQFLKEFRTRSDVFPFICG